MAGGDSLLSTSANAGNSRSTWTEGRSLPATGSGGKSPAAIARSRLAAAAARPRVLRADPLGGSIARHAARGPVSRTASSAAAPLGLGCADSSPDTLATGAPRDDLTPG